MADEALDWVAARAAGVWGALATGVCSRLLQSGFNPLRPNNDVSQTSHCNIKGLSVTEVMRIENTIIQLQFY